MGTVYIDIKKSLYDSLLVSYTDLYGVSILSRTLTDWRVDRDDESEAFYNQRVLESILRYCREHFDKNTTFLKQGYLHWNSNYFSFCQRG